MNSPKEAPESSPKVYFSVGQSSERLIYEDPEDAVAEWLDENDDHGGDIPKEIRVYAFAQDRLAWEVRSFGAVLLENALETLDDEYGNPDDATTPTAAMTAAAEALAAAIFKDYAVWTCKRCPERDTTVRICGNPRFKSAGVDRLDETQGPAPTRPMNPPPPPEISPRKARRRALAATKGQRPRGMHLATWENLIAAAGREVEAAARIVRTGDAITLYAASGRILWKATMRTIRRRTALARGNGEPLPLFPEPRP